jgi:hypothetical protein
MHNSAEKRKKEQGEKQKRERKGEHDLGGQERRPGYWGIVINKRVYTATAEAKTLLIRSCILQLRGHIGGFK